MNSLRINGSESNCGLAEINGVTHLDGPQFCADFVKHPQFNGYSVFIFSDAIQYGGSRIAEYIRKHKLGDLTESPEYRNSNSGNYIRVWIWYPNRQALKKLHPKPEKKSTLPQFGIARLDDFNRRSRASRLGWARRRRRGY